MGPREYSHEIPLRVRPYHAFHCSRILFNAPCRTKKVCLRPIDDRPRECAVPLPVVRTAAIEIVETLLIESLGCSICTRLSASMSKVIAQATLAPFGQGTGLTIIVCPFQAVLQKFSGAIFYAPFARRSTLPSAIHPCFEGLTHTRIFSYINLWEDKSCSFCGLSGRKQ